MIISVLPPRFYYHFKHPFDVYVSLVHDFFMRTTNYSVRWNKSTRSNSRSALATVFKPCGPDGRRTVKKSTAMLKLALIHHQR